MGPPVPSRWLRARERELENMETKIQSLEAEQPRLPVALTSGDMSATPTMHLLLRGDPKAKADEVAAGAPTVLTSAETKFDTGGRRLALARWLARPDHPLTSRVAVNRLWHYHFGRGLVGTPSNFGPGGEKPTHPELLDWLGDRFVTEGWSMKKMHRLIVTSATYRQSSSVSADAQARDPDNQLWSRFARRRLEAEAIRDAMLFTSGRLNPVMFGPGGRSRAGDSAALAPEAARSPLAVREGPQQSRRSIYLHVNRATPSVLLESFDAPPPACPCEKRVQTTVAPQALLLLNGPMVLELSGHLALRVKNDAGTDPAAQVDRLFRIALGRPPRETEREKALKFLADPALKAKAPPRKGATDPGSLGELAHVIYNTNEFIYVD
jgi:hypothetical protein